MPSNARQARGCTKQAVLQARCSTKVLVVSCQTTITATYCDNATAHNSVSSHSRFTHCFHSKHTQAGTASWNTPEHGIVILHIVVVQQRVHLQISPAAAAAAASSSIINTSDDNRPVVKSATASHRHAVKATAAQHLLPLLGRRPSAVPQADAAAMHKLQHLNRNCSV
jgi:hypothetical protein